MVSRHGYRPSSKYSWTLREAVIEITVICDGGHIGGWRSRRQDVAFHNVLDWACGLQLQGFRSNYGRASNQSGPE
jgi:hypothetical protein